MANAAVTDGLEMGQPDEDGKIEFVAKNFDQMSNGQVLSNTFDYNGNSWKLNVRKCGCQQEIVDVIINLELITKPSVKNITVRIRCPSAKPGHNVSDSVFDRSEVYTVDVFTFKGGLPVKDLKLEIQPLPDEPEPSPLSTVLQWFESETFGDVTIVAEDGKKFRCHRDICSEVLKLKINSGVEEAKNIVNIDGYNGDVVAQLLSFIYTNECGNIGPIATRLYEAAKEFKLAGLKVLCESAMAANLSAETVVKTFKLAKDEKIGDLFAKCVDYMKTHKDELPIEDLVAEALDVGAEPKAKRARKE